MILNEICVASTCSSFFSTVICSHKYLFIKYFLLEKGIMMVATIMFQCTSFRSEKVVSNQILVHVYRYIMSSLKSCIYKFIFVLHLLQVHLHFSLEILAQKIARQMYLFRLLFFIFKDPICHYTHVYDCTKCKM